MADFYTIPPKRQKECIGKLQQNPHKKQESNIRSFSNVLASGFATKLSKASRLRKMDVSKQASTKGVNVSFEFFVYYFKDADALFGRN